MLLSPSNPSKKLRKKNSPLRALLVQHATAALLAPDGIVTAQRELGAAVAADVVDVGALGRVDGPREVGAGARGGGAARRGDLVGFS